VLAGLLIANTLDQDLLSIAFWRIQTWTALCIWIRFLLYLRTFPRFSWMIRLIQSSIYDMRYFIMIFFFGVFAFADAFLSIDQIIAI